LPIGAKVETRVHAFRCGEQQLRFLRLVGKRWTLAILAALMHGPARFSERVALSGGGPSYRASTARLPDGTRRDVLTRYAAVLDAEVRGHWTDDRGGDLHPATADERLAFVDEADAVVRAFRALLDSQARAFGEGASRVAKLVPR